MAETEPPRKPLTCGLIMPISAWDECGTDHWERVKDIICQAVASIETPRFEVNLVSEDDGIGVIHKRIVQHVYSSDVVVCDVSGKNPNVMFELGMRLAFDRAAVVIKDDRTEYCFDTGVIEHVEYPRGLRYDKIQSFKGKLASKIAATYMASVENADYSSFLRSFGDFHTAAINEAEIPVDRVVIEMLGDLQSQLSRLGQQVRSISAALPATTTSWALPTDLSANQWLPTNDVLAHYLSHVAAETPSAPISTANIPIAELLKPFLNKEPDAGDAT